MNDIQLSKLLGWFSLGLGAAELFASRRIAAALGLERPLVQAFGVREVAAGLMVLDKPDTAMPLWGRVAGDAMDAAALGTALGRDNRRRHAAAWAAIALVGITLLDVACATALSARGSKALATARRTRLRA